MSKPKVRIAVSLLIGLVIVLAVFASVQAASSRASLSGERAVTTAGLLLDTSHVRSAGQNLSSYFYDESAYQNKGEGQGGCERDSIDD
ncbi:MAG: hypothetical protein AB1607_10070 [Chloroflexota bacterium]